ncbi:MAG: hypothetical protein PHF00_07320 [Elusimicrobia bacterium]|nr:hypothetical protein [Elusimicrobiota bacterium]
MNKRTLAATAATLVLATVACIAQQLDDSFKGAQRLLAATKTSEKRIQRGPVLLIERRDSPDSARYIDHTAVLVSSQKQKVIVLGLLQAIFPKNMGMPVNGRVDLSIGPDHPSVQTVEEYIEALKRGYAKRGQDYQGFPPRFDEIRAEIMADLGDNFAVVYRYIHFKSDPN